jgi:hypothetical protein
LIGYAIAAIGIGALGTLGDTSLAERTIAIVAPPFGFWFAIAIERRLTGIERIVFYRTAIAAWGSTIAIALALGARVAVVSDLVVVLVAAFLAFGRVGCFHVACCHGRPARFGVTYTHAHAVLGFPRRWVGTTILPVQLFEAIASATLAVIAAVAIGRGATAGTATCSFVGGYAVVRFVLELLRGDATRPYFAGASEAQWIALASCTAAAIIAWSPLLALAAAALALATIVLVVRSRPLVALFGEPDHLDELERVHRALAERHDGALVTTSAGLRVSVKRFPDGPLDVLWSHDRLREHDVRTLVRELAIDGEIIPAATAGMFHVLVSRPARPASTSDPS